MSVVIPYDPIGVQTDRNIPKMAVNYTDGAAIDGLSYPTSDTYNVMGPLYLPKIYGKDLSVFELASSGSIAVTLKDVYAFLLDKDLTTGTVTFQTTENAALNLSSGSNAAVVIDGLGSNISIASASDIWMNAGGSNAFVTLDGAGSNIFVGAASNITETAAQDFNIWGKRVYINGKLIAGDSNDPLFFGGSNAWIKINDSNMELYTQNQVKFTMSNHTYYDNKHDFVLTSETLDVSTSSFMNFTSSSNMTVHSLSNFSLTTEQDLNLTANSSIYSHSLIDTKFLADNDWSATSVNTLELHAGTDMHILADRALWIEGSSNMDVTTSNLTVVVNALTQVSSTGLVTIDAASGVHTTVTTGDFVLTNPNSGTTLTSGYTTLESVIGEMNIAATSDKVRVSAATELIFDSVNDTTITSTLGNIVGVAQNAVALTGATATIQAISGGAVVSAAADVSVVAGANFHSMSQLNTVFDAAGDIIGTASNNASLTAPISNKLITGSDTSFELTPGLAKTHVGGKDIITVTQDTVRINANLEIDGDITSIITYQETLQVLDQTITLSHTGVDAATMLDGVGSNDGSGIIVAGLPSADGIAPLAVTSSNLIEKSLKFRCPYPDSLLSLNAASNAANYPLDAFNHESYWDVRGGDLRLTLVKDESNHFTQFGFRIGAYGELELIKSWGSLGPDGETPKGSTDITTKVVSKFGRVINATGLVL